MSIDMRNPQEGEIKLRYNELSTLRNQYRDRSREYAKLTIPSLLPPVDDGTETSKFQHDFNTEGAKLVNSLANKYVQTMFPAGRSFIRLGLEEEQLQDLAQAGVNTQDVDADFAAVERAHRHRFELINARAVMQEAMQQLIVTGNIMLYKPKDGLLTSYALDEFVVRRSLDGTLMEFITLDNKDLRSLEQDTQAQVISALDLKPDETDTAQVKLFTYGRRDPDNNESWLVDQSVEDFNIGEQNTYTDENLRWMPAMWKRVRREQYGRGLVEEHEGSFWTMSLLTEAQALGCITIADIKYLVRPGSLINVQELNNAPSGSYHYGDPDDINAVTSDRARDFALIKDVIQDYKRHLGEVFMYMPSTMRDAERVTAEENRIRAAELENAHSGAYSYISSLIQRPLALLIFEEMGISKLEDRGIRVTITTGLEALSRGNENDKINHWISDLSQVNAIPEEARMRFRWAEFLKHTAAGRDVDHTGFIMSDEEVAAMQQGQQENQHEMNLEEQQAKHGQPMR